MANDLRKELEELEELNRLERKIAATKAPLGERLKEQGSLAVSGLAKAGKTIWDNLARGAGNTAAGLITDSREQQFPELFPEKSLKTKAADWIRKDVGEKLPVDPNENYVEKLMRAGTEAVGGGLLFPPALAKAPVSSLVTLFSGGMGAQAGGDLGENLGKNSPGLQPFLQGAGALLGGVVGALPVGLLTGPGLSSAEYRLRRATEGLTPDDFKQAEGNLGLFERTGAKTATLPEAFEGRTPLLGVAEKLRGEKGGEAFAALTAKRADDARALGQRALDAMGPEVDPNVVAGQTVRAANNTRDTLNATASKAMGEALAGKTVQPIQVFRIYRELLDEAKKHPNPSFREELVAAAKSMLDEHKKNAPITDLQTLSVRVKEGKTSPTNLKAATGVKIDDKNLKAAIARVEEKLGEISPDFKVANENFGQFHQNVIDPTMRGPLERLADKNPLAANEATVSRLEPLFKGNSPGTVEDALHQLSRPAITKDAPIDPQAVIRAWAENKMDRGSTDPGRTLRGMEGSSMEQRIAAALSAAGKDSTPVLEPLKASDKLQNFRGLPGMREQGDLSQASLLVRPRQSIGFRLTEGAREKTNAEIAKLLAPTKENLARLQEIAKFDPSVRQMLIARGIMVPQFSDKD